MDTVPQNRKPFGWWYKWMRIEPEMTVKVYHGYGDEDAILLYGHVFHRSPLAKRSYRKNFISNTISLVRMFIAKPAAGIKVKLHWGNQLVEAVTDRDGFFKLEWKSDMPLTHGWNLVTVYAVGKQGQPVPGEGKILIPYATQYAYVSDVDDTFLVSHSSKMGKRLHVLFTKNARTRKPFEGVVKHYQLLADSHAPDGTANPFFFVSSSEWNLYEYLKEFCRNYDLPEGVFLLSQLKQWYELLKTGQGKHEGKFMRIARLLKEFPHRKFVLLGDDTQLDPYIYSKIVEAFPGQVVAVYWRHIRKSRKPAVMEMAKAMTEKGVEVCYFKHSEEAIKHSRKIGLIEEAVL
jgi:phosphatidate phosphatase APP1